MEGGKEESKERGGEASRKGGGEEDAKMGGGTDNLFLNYLSMEVYDRRKTEEKKGQGRHIVEINECHRRVLDLFLSFSLLKLSKCLLFPLSFSSSLSLFFLSFSPPSTLSLSLSISICLSG